MAVYSCTPQQGNLAAVLNQYVVMPLLVAITAQSTFKPANTAVPKTNKPRHEVKTRHNKEETKNTSDKRHTPVLQLLLYAITRCHRHAHLAKQVTAPTWKPWPEKECLHSPVLGAQTLTVASSEPETTALPEVVNMTQDTLLSCPANTWKRVRHVVVVYFMYTCLFVFLPLGHSRGDILG